MTTTKQPSAWALERAKALTRPGYVVSDAAANRVAVALDAAREEGRGDGEHAKLMPIADAVIENRRLKQQLAEAKRLPEVAPDDRLRCEIEDGRLTISIGVETLRYCHNEREKDSEPGFGTGFFVNNADGFARDVALELMKEREDGSTILTDLLDKATECAANNGSIHQDPIPMPEIGGGE